MLMDEIQELGCSFCSLWETKSTAMCLNMPMKVTQYLCNSLLNPIPGLPLDHALRKQLEFDIKVEVCVMKSMSGTGT